MLLNNFLYTRSLNKNEHFHKVSSYSPLLPRTSIHTINKDNILSSDEYQEEIKNIKLGGGFFCGCGKEKDQIDDLEEEKETLEKKLKKEKKKLKKEEKKKEELEEEKKALEKEKGALEKEKGALEEEKGELEEGLNNCKEGSIVGGESIDGGGISHKFNNNDVIFDNLTKEGGKPEDENIKQVVVSFF